MKTSGILLLVLLLLVIVVACSRRKSTSTEADAQPGPGSHEGGKPTAKHGRGTFTIGKATTYMTGPVDAEGRIDYVTVLNDRLIKGVTAENNANVAIWKVIGPNPPGNEKVPPGFFERLGMSAPPTAGDYFIGLKAYCDRYATGQASAAYEAMAKFTVRPWTADENPTLSAWLHANAKPLTALRDAVKRTQYYNPLLPERSEKGLVNTVYFGLGVYRELAGALLDRAMLHLGYDQPAEAWQDLLTCHRLGRQVGQGGTLVEGLVAITIEQLACRAEVAFLDRAKPDAKTVEVCLRDLLALPRSRTLAEQIDTVERIWYLDSVMQFDRHGASQEHFYDENLQPYKHGLSDEALNGIDWNPALEAANIGYDRLAVTLREKDRGARVEKFTRLASETRPHYLLFVGGQGTAELKRAVSAKERGRVFGQMLFASSIPLFRKVIDAADRIQQTFDTLAVAFALAWYHHEKGRYPDRLEVLAPEYLKEVPRDLFSGSALIYRADQQGYLLYSVGVNGKDDGGRGPEDQPAGDDIVVRMPAK